VTRKAALGSLLVVGLIPFVLLGVVVTVARSYGLVRYDPAYFTEPYLTKYNTAGAVAKALEVALQTDDQALLAELEGLRFPGRLDTSPTISWVQLWARTDRYITYLYFDVSAYKPYLHHIEERRGRWVVSPPDVYYFVESGAYKSVFLTFSLIWWTSGMLTAGLVYLLSMWERLGTRV
jgi:hypothetical protein